MPTYDYVCRSCGTRFSQAMHVSEHDKRNVQCPRCGSNAVEQQLQPFFARTSKKS